MTVTLSQKSYNALLDDLEKLRERNAKLERKLDKEVKLSYEIEGNLYDVSKERDKIINDMAEVKRKAEAFDGIKKLRDNIKFIKDVSLSHANEEPVNQEMYWVHSLMDSLLEELEADHEG